MHNQRLAVIILNAHVKNYFRVQVVMDLVVCLTLKLLQNYLDGLFYIKLYMEHLKIVFMHVTSCHFELFVVVGSLVLSLVN